MRTNLSLVSSSALLLLLLAACSQEPVADSAAGADAANTGLGERIGRLAAALASAEDLRAVKKLQRAYGYYLDKGMWTDLAELFAEDAVANYPAGVFIGKESIRQHLYENVGGVEMGQVGLGDGRLYNHMNIQPVVHLDPSGGVAEGRWRAMAMFGSYGAASGTWAEGIYNMVYIKEGDTWKISKLEYGSGFGNAYTQGWGANPEAAPRRRNRSLKHPPDDVRNMPCEGFPEACITPFHYDNLGNSEAAGVWSLAADLPLSTDTDYQRRVGDLLHRAQLLRDEQELENLQRIYGYYLDRAQWDQVADLFAADGTIEMAQQGVYVGKPRVREFLNLLGPQGLKDGWLNDHVQLQIIVDVAADGLSARARSREWNMTGVYQEHGEWSEGVYENSFVKENGVWKIQALHYYPTFITAYDKGWTVDAQPAPGVSEILPPDRPPSAVYEIFPRAQVPPFHYLNPVTGQPPTYPAVGAPSAAAIAATLMPELAYEPAPVVAVGMALDQAETLIQQVKDHHEIENLENAYGYYLDKNLWNDLADLFAVDGSMELAQRGIYRGRERVRAFLFQVFGAEGPVTGRLGNHLHMQPVIHLAADGRSARVRSRMLQQLSFSGRPSMGAAIYENELVKEDGAWKFKSTHAYNTFTAAYEGGWVKNPGTRVPGPSASFPPDAPPSLEFQMFPTVYEIPIHYANPVTGP
ncbi:MAG: nuclear transport factor 2 family protein [Pseudomonadales bacterium]|nr:nuclear transport factor 2 family protein [Pseudomonadales bacterium]